MRAAALVATASALLFLAGFGLVARRIAATAQARGERQHHACVRMRELGPPYAPATAALCKRRGW